MVVGGAFVGRVASGVEQETPAATARPCNWGGGSSPARGEVHRDRQPPPALQHLDGWMDGWRECCPERRLRRRQHGCALRTHGRAHGRTHGRAHTASRSSSMCRMYPRDRGPVRGGGGGGGSEPRRGGESAGAAATLEVAAQGRSSGALGCSGVQRERCQARSRHASGRECQGGGMEGPGAKQASW